MKAIQNGNTMAAISFTLWGLLPLYYHFLPNAATDELLAVRILSSVPLAIVISRIITGRWPDFRWLIQQKRNALLSLIAGLLMSVSWCAFVWALTNERVMDASLGFFISPLTMIALGVLILKERLSQGQKIALIFAVLGLAYSIFHFGELPIIAISMALFFTLYGWAKREIRYEWSQGLIMENLLLAPIALIYMLVKSIDHSSQFSDSDYATQALFIGSALATLLPLVFYSVAIRVTPMSNVGLMQYIEPSIQFLLAIFVFAEPFNHVKATSFGLIWLGLAFLLYESYRLRKC
ncbi:EamA family transporter RarD [Vibrio sonorensis]|uniref:EamA family transporter RarD n=1 Tax=Vibrio sonorensis TaxID=1004316 RepID=UPI0008D9FBD7|nr:EamA family transporter RarD [Vibrio sonorensis]